MIMPPSFVTTQSPDKPTIPDPVDAVEDIWPQVFLIEDDAARATRRALPGVSSTTKREITVRVHQIQQGKPDLKSETRYDAGTLEPNDGRAAVALGLLDELRPQPGAVIAAATVYGLNHRFLVGVLARGLNFAVELPPSAAIQPAGRADWSRDGKARVTAQLLAHASWRKVSIVHPTTRQPISFLLADFGLVLRQGIQARLVVFQTGEVLPLQRGTIFALISDEDAAPEQILPVIGWTRWIRLVVRRSERKVMQFSPPRAGTVEPGDRSTAQPALPVRANITLARQQDEAERAMGGLLGQAIALRGQLCRSRSVLTAAEIFAGGGGMGLGFLLSRDHRRRYRLVFSAEVHPVYTQTLRHNHQYWAGLQEPARRTDVPARTVPLDLREEATLAAAREAAATAGGLDVLIGGPPCQGFSSANRNSGHSSNPHNHLVDVFLRYVEELKPRVFLMENVQGIVWTPKGSNGCGPLSTAQDFIDRAQRAGYLIFPKLLDAVWYGVPQHRNRFFILGIAADLGYTAADFGTWGPFPQPTHGPGTPRRYVTVGNAMQDLPWRFNGDQDPEIPYQPDRPLLEANEYLQEMRRGAPDGVIWDHVCSRHAPYVIDRFSELGEGDNWEAIERLLTNYADIRRTHSNIYRRLRRDEPSITIGHYRKSMLVHPTQPRGLTLREACRLQSFPDWFRFAGTVDGTEGGLTHKQQQLANAVCPLVTRAIAEFILRL